jgi:lipopolysaccharide export system protein LptA
MNYGGQAKGEVTFQRDVTLNNGPQHLRADALTVQMTGDNKPAGFTAAGNVSIEQEGYRLTAGKVVASAGPDGQVKEFVATGGVLVRQLSSDGGNASDMTADKVVSSVDKQGGISGFVATGHVVVTQIVRKSATSAGKTTTVENTRTMRADRVVTTLNADRKPEKMTASGSVVSVEEEGLTAKGSLLEWSLKTGAGVVTGSPVELRQGRSRLYGDRVEFSQELGRMSISSGRRVEGIVQRQ